MKSALYLAVLGLTLIVTPSLFSVASCQCIYDIPGGGFSPAGYVNLDCHPFPDCKPKAHHYNEKCTANYGEEKWDFEKGKSHCKSCDDFGC